LLSATFGFAFALLACVRAVADHHNSPQRAISLRLFAAIRKGDAAAVKRMLESGVSANSHEIMLTRPNVATHSEGGKEYPGASAIMVACESGNVTVLRLLVEHGAPVNPRTPSEDSPIMQAVGRRNTAAVRYLLEHGASANQTDQDGQPIIIAAAWNDLDTIKVLLDHGADINAGKENTLLMEAVSASSTDVVKLLLKRGVDPNLRRNGTTALEIAEQRGDDEIADALRDAGARGRTKIQMQRSESRQHRNTLPAYSLPAPKTPTKPVTRRTEADDYAIITAIARDMLTRKNKENPFYKVSGNKIVLSDSTFGRNESWYDYMEYLLSDDQANEIKLAMRENLLSRNRQPARFDHTRFREKGLVTMTESNVEKIFGPFRSRNIFRSAPPPYRGWFACNLPGYSRKRVTAVVPFRCGPEGFGTTGVCFLVRSKGTWRVKWVTGR